MKAKDLVLRFMGFFWRILSKIEKFFSSIIGNTPDSVKNIICSIIGGIIVLVISHMLYYGTDASGHISMEVIYIIFVLVIECIFIITYYKEWKVAVLNSIILAMPLGLLVTQNKVEVKIHLIGIIAKLAMLCLAVCSMFAMIYDFRQKKR